MKVALKVLSFTSLYSFADAQTSSCTGSAANFETPSSSNCMQTWRSGKTYSYPSDFEGILNDVTIYVCPTSDLRVIISNGIPDHTVVQGNPNSPCEKNWAVSMPLNPTVAASHAELPVRGIVAMAVNGVPAYGPQEAGSTNAVEPEDGASITDAQFWYGHAAFDNDWHVHNPYLGEENPTESDLLGYALDGFPIYGPLSDDSSLDACNGRTVNGSYQYHVRELSQVDSSASYCNGSNPENNWNYILGCYSGSLDNTSVDDSSTFSLPSDCVEDDGTDTPSPTATPTVSPTTSPTASPIASNTSSSPSKAITPAPTSTPTSSSTSSDCVDSTVRFKLEWNGKKITRGCDWVGNKATNQRCDVEGVSAMCAVTCNACSTCTDSSLRFKVEWNDKKITRGCEWVANKATIQRCKVDGVTAACSFTCGEC